jgi:hypothetical protein
MKAIEQNSIPVRWLKMSLGEMNFALAVFNESILP